MARRVSKPAAPTSVEAVRHTGDSRVNIPTAELGPLADAEATGPLMLRYPRDPSLDPQLVWKGKDEQDGEDLVVPTLPIHIQEQISPKAIIEDLRATTAAGRETQLDLFHSDFNGMAFDERVEFDRHPMKWSNRMILGDSMRVMTSLAEKEGLKGQVQTIVVDPPYGVSFRSNWQVSTRDRDVTDGRASDATRQPEQVQAFRDTWQLGIHSYLSYLRDRLAVARDLLTESGSIFVQIGDENVHLVRSILDEVFGPKNAVVTIIFQKKGATTPTDPVNDYLLWYAKDRGQVKVRQIFAARSEPEEESRVQHPDRTGLGLRPRAWFGRCRGHAPRRAGVQVGTRQLPACQSRSFRAKPRLPLEWQVLQVWLGPPLDLRSRSGHAEIGARRPAI